MNLYTKSFNRFSSMFLLISYVLHIIRFNTNMFDSLFLWCRFKHKIIYTVCFVGHC